MKIRDARREINTRDTVRIEMKDEELNAILEAGIRRLLFRNGEGGAFTFKESPLDLCYDLEPGNSVTLQLSRESWRQHPLPSAVLCLLNEGS
jgi:hypothetical protein